MRLAELISEEAKYHYMVAYEREGGKDGSQLHVPQVRELKLQAIDIYENILKNYPDTHLADRILFNISHEHRELGDFDKMLAALQRLVDNYPQSPYRAEALLVLGDYYFDKVELATAERYYEGIIKARDPLLLGLAQYKRRGSRSTSATATPR
jgi:tetratricopeptide (TPR) repeat protein